MSSAVGNCTTDSASSNYKKSFQHYAEYYEGCTIEEADENQTENDTEENVELEMIDMQSLLAIRIYYAAKYGLKSVKKSADYVLKCAPNNESADCKNLACFKGKSDRGA